MVSCPEDFPFTLNAGEELVCTYEHVLSGQGDGTGTNTATVDISDGADFSGTFYASADYDFATATITDQGPTSVIVDDDRDTEGNFPAVTSGDATYDYDETFSCSSEPNDYTSGKRTDTYDNTATLSDSSGVIDSDDASVTVDCYLPSVSKTAAGTNDETHTWTIDKTPDATYNLFAGDSTDHDYTIALDETVTSDNYVVSGTVTLSNPNPDSVAPVTVADQLSDGTPVSLPRVLTIDTGDTTGFRSRCLSAAVVECSYSVGDAGGNATSNIATMSINGVDQSDTANFTYEPEVTNPSVNVTDDNGTPGGYRGRSDVRAVLG